MPHSLQAAPIQHPPPAERPTTLTTPHLHPRRQRACTFDSMFLSRCTRQELAELNKVLSEANRTLQTFAFEQLTAGEEVNPVAKA